MSPSFLTEAASPAIHSSTVGMLALWRERARLAEGRPFDALHDMLRGTVDIISAATFGFEIGATTAQFNLLASIKKLELPRDTDTEAVFPVAEDPPAYTSIRTMVDSIEIGMQSPMPRQHFTLALKLYPYLVKAKKHRDVMIREKIEASWAKFSRNDSNDGLVKSAVDLIVQREAQMARKEGRLPMYNTQAIRDELFGFIQAGHETTSTTICWAIKHLTEHQEIQQKLRSEIRIAHMRAVNSHELPTAQEIVKANVPYLDAFIEESHRMGTTVPAVVRRATKDTVILGHHIPKGTDVFMITNGPSFQSPAFPIAESMRTKSSQEAKDRYGMWEDSNIQDFVPERWLVKEESGKTVFNPRAGPVLPYGMGVRGCFGMYRVHYQFPSL